MNENRQQGEEGKVLPFAFLRYDDSALSNNCLNAPRTLSHMSGAALFKATSTGSEICLLKFLCVIVSRSTSFNVPSSGQQVLTSMRLTIFFVSSFLKTSATLAISSLNKHSSSSQLHSFSSMHASLPPAWNRASHSLVALLTTSAKL